MEFLNKTPLYNNVNNLKKNAKFLLLVTLPWEWNQYMPDIMKKISTSYGSEVAEKKSFVASTNARSKSYLHLCFQLHEQDDAIKSLNNLPSRFLTDCIDNWYDINQYMKSFADATNNFVNAIKNKIVVDSKYYTFTDIEIKNTGPAHRSDHSLLKTAITNKMFICTIVIDIMLTGGNRRVRYLSVYGKATPVEPYLVSPPAQNKSSIFTKEE